MDGAEPRTIEVDEEEPMKSEDEIVAYSEGEAVEAGSRGGAPSLGTFEQLGVVAAIGLGLGGFVSAYGYFTVGGSGNLLGGFINMSPLFALLALLARRIRFDTLRTFLFFFSLLFCMVIPGPYLGSLTHYLVTFSFFVMLLSFSEGVVGHILGDRDNVSLVGGLMRVALSAMMPVIYFKQAYGFRAVSDMLLFAIVFSFAHLSVIIRLHYLAKAEKQLKIEEKGKS